MNFIDILILFLSIAGLVYFAFDRVRYSNKNVYCKKLERLNEIRKTIIFIETENAGTDEIIKSMNADMVCDDETADKLIKYRDNEEKLEYLKDEKNKIERYIKHARSYIKNITYR